MRRFRLALILSATLAAIACSHDSTAPVPTRDILITDNLGGRFALDVSIDGASFGSVIPEPLGTEFHIPANAANMTYVVTLGPLPPGFDVKPDIIGATGSVAITGSRYTINNVIGGITYFDPIVTNNSGAVVYIGIFRAGALTCLGPTVSGVFGITDFGYWRLDTDTEIRAYSGIICTGTFHAWVHSDLAAFDPESGTISLTVGSVPQ